MRLLLISTHNFATNPRLVKEIELAIVLQHEVTVVCFEFGKWSKPLNDAIYQRLKDKIRYYPLAGDRSAGWSWLVSSLLGKITPSALQLFPRSIFFQSIFSNKRSWLLLRNLHKVTSAIDLVIAHNAGSFLPAMRFARQRGIPYAIDLEDYHPGEGTGAAYAQYHEALLKKVLPGAAYLSAASPLILKYSLAGLPAYTGTTRVVLNYFPAEEFRVPIPAPSGRLRLVWFSQQVAKGRGLEELVPLVAQFPANMELHLYGNVEASFKERWLAGHENIIVHGPLPQADLHGVLQQYDVGLAIENKASNFNRDICLTNKLLAYFQSGLYVLASATMAQEEFIKQYPLHGIITQLNNEALSTALATLQKNSAAIRLQRDARYTLACQHNWAREAAKLQACWEAIETPSIHPQPMVSHRNI